MTTSPATIDSVSRDILLAIAPDELDRLPRTAEQIFAGGEASRRAMDDALVGAVGLAGFLLTILNGVACWALTDNISDRSRRRALTGLIAPAGRATQVPPLSAVQAARVGAHVLGLARKAGIPDEAARQLAALVEASLQLS
jgi:hypothetical protein